MPNLLIEIGVEELPVGSLDVIYDELAAKTRQKLTDERIAFGDVKVEATPRRIALFVQGIAAMQPDRELEISGPSYEKCYDAQGKSTAVLQGFLRSKQSTEKDVEVRDTPKGKFIFLRKKEKGGAVATLLPNLIKGLLASLSFPKLMRWESTGFRFPRPIRWLVVLMDAKKVPVILADVKSGNTSFGHRFLSPKSFTILKADWKAYIALLKKKHVYLPIATRETLVRGALKNRFGQKQSDEELAHMNAQLVEEPFFVEGTFSQEYLELPAEVLASCMKKNQKVFACQDAKGKMKNQFIAVMNGKRNGLAKIRADYDNVLDSRLKDARYFYEIDTRESIENKKPKLAELVYLGKLGSVLDKTERLEKMAPEFAAAAGQKELAHDLARVAALSKIDLVTHLVYEMPDLQGIVGREYAREAKEKDEVALAIGTQYLPKNLTEDQAHVKKSMSLLGALFGIMDRLDLLVGALGSGIEPTGSQDPFALRRAGGIVVKLIRAFDVSFSLTRVLEVNMKLYGNKLTKGEDLRTRFSKFIQERVSFELGVKPGTRPYEILQAVMRASCEDIADVFRRFETLSGIDFKILAKAAKVIQRTANMLKGYGKVPGEPKEELLVEVQEKKLFELIRTRMKEVADSLERKEYEKATRLFAEIFLSPLHDFFESVLVNAEDAALRENRMALVAKVSRLFTGRLADLSALSRIDEE
ncbi:MAG: glycine--tRNA ligase subunit beta [Candidatus Omnitrophica bacterium]|nr:glycine--tRNA ligase subunit beta [Candidatus Omnitrophota bacterium]